MSSWLQWLDDRIGPLRGRRVLVLCRTKASLALVRRWAARRGGVLGLEAATPGGLAQQVHQEPILAGPRRRVVEEEAMPAGSALARRVGARPGLTGVARRWTRHLRLARAVGAEPEAPDWLDELVRAGFAVDEGSAAMEHLVQAVRARGRRLTVTASWDRVVTVGFDRGPPAESAHEHWLARALAGPHRAPTEPEGVPIPARMVPDVAAEARLAVALAAGHPDGTLVLVNELATARRVRDAARRSGVPCAWRDAEALSVHGLALAVRRAAAWFSDAPDPPIQLADLVFVLGRTSLGRALHPAAEAAITGALGAAEAGGDTPREPLRRSAVKRVLEGTRMLDGALSTWRARVREQVDAAGAAPELRGAAAGVWIRLELLHAALTGRSVEEVLGEALGNPITFDADDFDDVVATLLGDLGDEWLGPAHPSGSTLGAVQRFLLACRVRLHDDAVARAIVGALRDRATWPVSPSHVHHALAGAVDAGVLSDGVDVVMIDDYDGRPCDHLVVLDVHDHGLARRPSPDPLLDDAELAALGACAGRAQVDERIRQVRRAVGAAARSTAIVTRRDATGREVVPPIQLELAFEGPEVPSYGLGLPELPETRDPWLEPRVGREAPAPVDGPDWVVAHLCHQACAEWYRDGRGPPTFVAAPPSPTATLADARRAEVPFAPAHLLPYLGFAEVPEAALPAGAHSVSRLLQPLARCGYQAFTRVVLGVYEPDPIADDLDPKEVGRAVHRALELVTPEVRWRGVDAPAETRVEALQAATRVAFDEAVRGLGLSPARQVAVDGHRDRWNTHWPLYVRSRELRPQNGGPAKVLDGYPFVPEWVAKIRARVPAAAGLTDKRIAGWVLWAAWTPPDALVDMHQPLFLRESELDSMPPSAYPDLRALVQTAEWAALHRWLGEMRARMDTWGEPPHATAAEVPFGPLEPPRPPAPLGGAEGSLAFGTTVLRLGSAELELSGLIDRLDFVSGPRGERFVGVVDFKTGQARDGWAFRRDQVSLKDPQLWVYAMVVERASREDRLPEALRGARVLAIAHDRVRSVVDDPEGPQRDPKASDTWMPVDAKVLGWAAGQLGVLLDDARAGRWPLRPRSDTCPMLSGWSNDRCAMASACRLRALPGGEVA